MYRFHTCIILMQSEIDQVSSSLHHMTAHAYMLACEALGLKTCCIWFQWVIHLHETLAVFGNPLHNLSGCVTSMRIWHTWLERRLRIQVHQKIKSGWFEVSKHSGIQKKYPRVTPVIFRFYDEYVLCLSNSILGNQPYCSHQFGQSGTVHLSSSKIIRMAWTNSDRAPNVWGSKLLYLGILIPPLVGNPYNGYIKAYYWIDDHSLLHGNNGSLDPSLLSTKQTECLAWASWLTIVKLHKVAKLPLSLAVKPTPG